MEDKNYTVMEYTLRKAVPAELPAIWEIIQQAIIRRKADGSQQWQDGYPNPGVLQADIERGVGFVLLEENTIVGYTAILINDEPQYANIEGRWLTNGDFIVVHRVAISGQHTGKGLAQKMLGLIEQYAISKGIYSVKADTNFDNPAMLKTFEKSGYVYCGEVYFRGSARMAFERVLSSGD